MDNSIKQVKDIFDLWFNYLNLINR
jgi:hypothetical protein